MTTATLTTWKPGMDLPYIVSFGENAMLAISLRAAWLKADRSGRPLLLPPAVRRWIACVRYSRFRTRLLRASSSAFGKRWDCLRNGSAANSA